MCLACPVAVLGVLLIAVVSALREMSAAWMLLGALLLSALSTMAVK